MLLQKLNETNIAASLQNNNIRLLDRAVVPVNPVWPRKRQIALVSLLAGIFFGSAAAYPMMGCCRLGWC